MNITTRDFLQTLYGKCTEGCITITTLPDSRNEHIPVTELDKAAERIKVLGTSANTYYCVALRQEGLPPFLKRTIIHGHCNIEEYQLQQEKYDLQRDNELVPDLQRHFG